MAMTGSCRCGKVKYTVSADPIFVGVCHCRSCQKETGSAFATVIGLPSPALAVTGSLKTFDDVGDSGKATHSRFCPECGSTMVHEADIMAGVSMVGAGTLDDPSWVKPAMQIFCDSKQPWVSLGGDLTSFPKVPG